jgi:hypothetical protein
MIRDGVARGASDPEPSASGPLAGTTHQIYAVQALASGSMLTIQLTPNLSTSEP